jgi:hypothetical protein
MHIVVVGGLERHESEIERRAGERGHTIEFHRGRVGGRRDPTASVDAATAQEILSGLKSVVEGRTVLLATHRPALLRLADRVVVLEGGRIVRQGTHASLLHGGGAYAEAHGPSTGVRPPAPRAAIEAE